MLARCSWRRHIAPVKSSGDLDQTTSSDVRLVLPPGELDEIWHLWFGHFLHYMETQRHLQIPELQNVSHCHHTSNEQQPRVIFTENLVIFGCVVLETRELTNKQTYKPTNIQTNRHTDPLITIPHTPTYWEWRNEWNSFKQPRCNKPNTTYNKHDIQVPVSQLASFLVWPQYSNLYWHLQYRHRQHLQQVELSQRTQIYRNHQSLLIWSVLHWYHAYPSVHSSWLTK